MSLLDEVKRIFQPTDDDVAYMDEHGADGARMAVYMAHRPAEEERPLSLEEGLAQARRNRR